MRNNSNVITTTILLFFTLSCSAGNNDTIVSTLYKKNAISIYLTYNVTGNNNYNWINPTGYVANGVGTFPYYMINQPQSTVGYDIEFNHSFFIKQHIAVNLGFGILKTSEYWKTILYIDSNIYKPNLIHETKKSYLLKTPITVNYYKNRFIISMGVNLQYLIHQNNIAYYYDGTSSINTADRFTITGHLQESIAYKLFKKTAIYLTVLAEQGNGFYKNENYSNKLLLGISCFL